MAVANTQQVAQAYAYCQDMARRHYENFPVASLILPRHLRQPINAIYAFARTADDFADEGDMDSATRLAKLKAYDDQLDLIAAHQPVEDPIFVALAHSISIHQLPIQLFHDLISAFRQDVTKNRYTNLDEVWDYCRNSANPVGRLLLHLTRDVTTKNLDQSDAICSALQLINFLQDISQDLEENNRIYLPQDDMSRFGVNEEQLRERRNNDTIHSLMNHFTGIAREKMLQGKPLGRAVKGRFGFQLRIMINGGLRILELLEQENDAFARPRLQKRDWLLILLRAI